VSLTAHLLVSYRSENDCTSFVLRLAVALYCIIWYCPLLETMLTKTPWSRYPFQLTLLLAFLLLVLLRVFTLPSISPVDAPGPLRWRHGENTLTKNED
jgi:hypothetical protein